MQKLRIATIGAGSASDSRTRQYLAVITQLTDMYELCAVCDRNAERAREAAEAYGAGAWYTDIEQMLKAEKPDVAFRLTPTDSCVGICVRAAELGSHVLTEIPIAPTLPMAREIVQACDKNGVVLEVAENVWLWPQEQLKQRIVQAGLLGKLVHARLTYPCGSYHGFNGVRMIIGQEARRVLGYAGKTELLPTTDYGGHPMTSAFWESAIVEFPELTCLYEMPPKNRTGWRQWDIEGTQGYLTGDDLFLYEDGRENHYPIGHTTTEVHGQTVLETLRVDTEPPVVWENPYARYGISDMDDVAKAAILESMYHAVAEGTQPRYGWENAWRDQELCIALRESDLRGNIWIELPLQETTELEERMHQEFRRRYGCDPITDIDAQLHAAYDRTSVMWTVAGWL